jgi:hypothetical protein
MLMIKPTLAAALAGLMLVAGCQSSGGAAADRRAAAQSTGVANPFLWRATLDTMQALPIQNTDPVGGLINYDWRSFPEAPGERIKATVFILDSRLRADAVKVTVYRQVNEAGQWVDAGVDPETTMQLENRILDRARLLRSSQPR